MNISQIICEEMRIDEINFENEKNFIKLLDLIFKYKNKFNLNIRHRKGGFIKDVLEIFYEELLEAKYEIPQDVKALKTLIQGETWT
jgi:hypothetical protein